MELAPIEQRASHLCAAFEQQAEALFAEQRQTLEAMRSKQLRRAETASANAEVERAAVEQLERRLAVAKHKAGLASHNAADAINKISSIDMAIQALDYAASLGQRFIELSTAALQDPARLFAVPPPASE